MNVNRIFICHAIRNEDQQDIQVVQYLMQGLQSAGREVIINNNTDSDQSFFQQFYQELPTCQMFILFQTANAFASPRVHKTVELALELAKQQPLQIVRFICPSGTERISPEIGMWQVLTTFDGSDNYWQACEQLVSSVIDNPTSISGMMGKRITGVQPPMPYVGTGLAPAGTSQPQTSSNWLQLLPPKTTQTAVMGPSSPLSPVSVPKTSSQPNNDQPRRPPSIWKTRLQKFVYKADAKIGRRKLLMYALVMLVILTIVGSAGTLFYKAQANNGVTNPAYKTPTAQNRATATAQANVTATAQAYPSLVYPSYLSGSGTPAFADSLSQAGQWQSESDNTGGTCQFINGAYHVSQQQGPNFNHCDTRGTFSNFAIEVQLTITNGACGGMIFRNDGKGQYYYFDICRDGTYKVATFFNNTGTDLRPSTSSSAIHSGLDQWNTVAVVASGSTMTFYANGQQIDQVQNDSYTSGSIGLIAKPTTGLATDVAYRNVRAWTL